MEQKYWSGIGCNNSAWEQGTLVPGTGRKGIGKGPQEVCLTGM